MTNTPTEVEAALHALLRAVGRSDGNQLDVAAVRRIAGETHQEIVADNLAHGGSLHEPYWNLIMADENPDHDAVYVLTVWRPDALTMYVGRAPRQDVLEVCDRFSLSEIDAVESEMERLHQIRSRHVRAPRSVAEYWLSQ